MLPFQNLRDDLSKGKRTFDLLDAAQLVKHAFALRTHNRPGPWRFLRYRSLGVRRHWSGTPGMVCCGSDGIYRSSFLCGVAQRCDSPWSGPPAAAAVSGGDHQAFTGNKNEKFASHSIFRQDRVREAPRTQFKVQTGYIPVSTPEATALDLLRYSRWIGGLDRVYTVLQELGEKVDPSKLLVAAKADGNLTYAQRAGWLLEKASFSEFHKTGRLAGEKTSGFGEAGSQCEYEGCSQG